MVFRALLLPWVDNIPKNASEKDVRYYHLQQLFTSATLVPYLKRVFTLGMFGSNSGAVDLLLWFT